MDLRNICFKCKKSEGRFVSRDGISKMYCDRCFTEFCTKTTRDQLFSHCYLPCDEPVAIGVSGGPHSMFLLHQLGILRKQGQLRQGTGTVHFELLPFLLREDELVLPPLPQPSECSTGLFSSENFTNDMAKTNSFVDWGLTQTQHLHKMFLEQFDKLEELVRKVPLRWEYANFPLFEENEIHVYAYSDFLNTKQLRALRHSMHHPHLSLTQREELYERVRRRVLCLATRKRIDEWRARRAVAKCQECLSTPFPRERYPCSTAHNSSAEPVPLKLIDQSAPSSQGHSRLHWNHVAVGEAVTHCCIAALKSIVQGGTGDQISHLSGPRGYLADTVVLRPLRGLFTKEVILYNRLHGIPPTYTPALRTMTTLPSIHRVLEQFVHTLVCNYWTSTFNVLNTVKKIAVGPPAVAAVLEGLLLDEVPDMKPVTANGGGGVEAVPRQKPQRAQKNKKLNALGRSAQLYHAQLQRTEPPIHHVRKLAMEDVAVHPTAQTDLYITESLPKKARGNVVSGSSCFLCGCPFSEVHGVPLTEKVFAAMLIEDPLPRAEDICYDFLVCHGCYGCLHDILEAKTTPHELSTTARSTSPDHNAQQLLPILASLSSSST